MKKSLFLLLALGVSVGCAGGGEHHKEESSLHFSEHQGRPSEPHASGQSASSGDDDSFLGQMISGLFDALFNNSSDNGSEFY